MQSLADLKPQEKGVIMEVIAQDKAYKKIIDLGFVKGVIVQVISLAPFNGAIKIKIKDSNFILRKEDAKKIIIRKI